MFTVLKSSFDTMIRHVKAGNINWPMSIYILLVHLAGCIGVFHIPYCSKYTLLLSMFFFFISELGITAGAHRLWSHRSYKATLPLRIFLMLAASISNQGSIWHWSRDHRVHHKHSEVSCYI